MESIEDDGESGQLNVRIPVDLRKRVNQWAAEEERSVSSLVRWALECYGELRPRIYGLVLEERSRHANDQR
jgi:hypothetical protein